MNLTQNKRGLINPDRASSMLFELYFNDIMKISDNDNGSFVMINSHLYITWVILIHRKSRRKS